MVTEAENATLMGDAEIEQRRADYLASYEAQRRAVNDPKLMALLWAKLADLEERHKASRV